MLGTTVKCEVCGNYYKLINNTLLKKHGLSPEDYRAMFPEARLYSEVSYKNNKIARKKYANTKKAKLRAAKLGKSNKGRQRTESWKKDRSERYTGKGNPFFNKTHSMDTRKKLSAHFQGVPIEEWNGFVNNENKRLWKSKRAVRWSREILERDDYTCALCTKRGGNLEAHHIVPRSEDSKRVYDLHNGITLCVSCHRKTYGKEAQYKERFEKMVAKKYDSILDKPSKVLKSLL